MPTNKELLKRIEFLEEKLAALSADSEPVQPVKCEPWRADLYGEYWYIDTDGKLEKTTDHCHEEDDFSYQVGNYFRTVDQANKARERLLALGKFRHKAYELNEGILPEAELRTSRYYIFWNLREEEFQVRETSYTIGENTYFKTRELAERAISELEPDVLDPIFT